jgi:predicted RNase H-like HicB family nuclease
MRTDYMEEKMRTATYRILEDGVYFGSIPSARGVWAEAKTRADCEVELREVLEEWLMLSTPSTHPDTHAHTPSNQLPVN